MIQLPSVPWSVNRGLPAAFNTPTATVETYWAAYDARKPVVGVLPGAPVAPPPKGLPAGRPEWQWVERDLATSRVIYERPGVPMRIVDDLELRDGGWQIVRRSGQRAGAAR